MTGRPATLPWIRTANGLRLTVRLTPRGGRDALGGVQRDQAGRAQLLARVASPPLKGASNAALVRLVAKALGVPKSAVAITAGQSARFKTLAIAGNPAALEQALMRLI